METERLQGLVELAGVRHGFVPRVRGVEVGTLDKAEAVARLRPTWQARLATEEGIPPERLWTAEQVHGTGIAVVPGGGDDAVADSGGSTVAHEVPGVDGLVTGCRGVFLGILVADCCAVFLVDRGRRGCALVHAGRRGTELGIVPAAIGLLRGRFGIPPGDLRVQLSPCIRPPRYEVDFAAEIRRQALEAGVRGDELFDAGTCTAEAVDRYYSYRHEQGRTGRMLAFLGIEEGGGDSG